MVTIFSVESVYSDGYLFYACKFVVFILVFKVSKTRAVLYLFSMDIFVHVRNGITKLA